MDRPRDRDPNNVTLLRLLTYDLKLNPTEAAKKYKDKRMKDFAIGHLKNYDVLALQGCYRSPFSSSRVKQLVQFGKCYGMDRVKSAPRPWYMPLDAGLLIFSRYPIVERKAITFKSQGGVTMCNGAIYARINVPDGDTVHTFHLFNTCLCPSRGAAYDAVRIEQAEELLQFVAAQQDKHPVLVCGNFNINGRDSSDITVNRVSGEYTRLLARFLHYTDVFLHLQPAAPFDIRDRTAGSGSSSSPSPPTHVHPPTYGDVICLRSTPGAADSPFLPKETLLTWPPDRGSCQRLDYILMGAGGAGIGTAAPFPRAFQAMQPVSCDIQEFLVLNRPYTQLSDHYGLCAQFVFAQPPPADTSSSSSSSSPAAAASSTAAAPPRNANTTNSAPTYESSEVRAAPPRPAGSFLPSLTASSATLSSPASSSSSQPQPQRRLDDRPASPDDDDNHHNVSVSSASTDSEDEDKATRRPSDARAGW
eukprot:gnl/Spiro4/22644_TR11165_c0_g1_i2.p1 gnl/Spiro4/22644_TR11165_c0_g1~~gnl/Spiro4/22644_TR11165_c0_g1_i2.p1  ORF type:complete len:501 (+),score=183.44 gnl/Spiro4/22644_TR11165_c0_g1_i2:81-1505(+)